MGDLARRGRRDAGAVRRWRAQREPPGEPGHHHEKKIPSKHEGGVRKVVIMPPACAARMGGYRVHHLAVSGGQQERTEAVEENDKREYSVGKFTGRNSRKRKLSAVSSAPPTVNPLARTGTESTGQRRGNEEADGQRTGRSPPTAESG